MARTTRPLTNTEVLRAKASEKDLTLHDDDGLFLVAHGLHSIASTALNEAGFNFDVIEATLSHHGKTEVRRAYNRSTYFSQRKELMNWWGNTVKNLAY